MKVPVEGSRTRMRVGMRAVAVFTSAVFLAGFALAEPPAVKPLQGLVRGHPLVAPAHPMVRSGGGGTATDPSSTIPSGWTCVGSCGTDGADGVVTLSPIGSSHYEWVSTAGGSNGVGALPTGALGSETDGSTLATQVFTATAGTSLNFYFNYVTSDGAGYADYAWAELFNSANTPVALLFTARTVASGTIVPGTGMPTPLATLTPASVPIIGGPPTWAPLGTYSGSCYATGCGYTGWVNSSYVIPAAGSYYLKVGVVNWSDTLYDSGLALDGVTVGGAPITPPTTTPTVPALSTWGLILLALLMMAAAARLFRRASVRR
jgi:hypothetical protein